MRELTYRENGETLIPNLTLDDSAAPPIGKYGWMRWDFLMKHCTVLYNEIILTGRLYAYLREIDAAAEARLATVMPQLIQDANITETASQSGKIHFSWNCQNTKF